MNDAFIIVVNSVSHLHLATIHSCSVPASSRDRGKFVKCRVRGGAHVYQKFEPAS